MHYAIAPFDHIYLVSDKQRVFSASELTDVERALDVELPDLYKLLLQIVGHGLYCDHIRLFSPEELVTRNAALSKASDSDWAAQSRIITPDIINSRILLADTIDGDHIIWSPRMPEKVYVLLRGNGYRKACIIPYGFRDLMLWVDDDGRFEATAPLAYFTSWIDRQEQWLSTKNSTLMASEVTRVIERAIGNKIYLRSSQTYDECVVTTCFIPEMRGVFSIVLGATTCPYDIEMSCNLEYDTDFISVAQDIIHELKGLGFQ
jgi:hypothetical protein